MADIHIRSAFSADDMEAVRSIRQQVFIDEQGVFPEEEWDGLDGTAQHYLAYTGGQPVATARLRRVQKNGEQEYAKIERVCVLKAARGKGIGYQLLQSVIEDAIAEGLNDLRLEAQTVAIPFYENLGFEPYGESYMDARIQHRRMKMLIPEIA
ncbi:GNAT family N-acetyltransferase [bacterium]|nr:GNAT family N-acetyltransferase [bacterium]